jgi:hypothetical protein
MYALDVQGIDSDVAEYANRTLLLNADYGVYSGFPETLREEPQYTEEVWCLDENRVLVCQFVSDDPSSAAGRRASHPRTVAMFFLNVDSMTPRLALWAQCRTPEAVDLALRVFRTVRFRPRAA